MLSRPSEGSVNRAQMQPVPLAAAKVPGYSVQGISQVRILEWVAMPSSRASSNPGIETRSPALQVDSLPSESDPELSYLRNEEIEVFLPQLHPSLDG